MSKTGIAALQAKVEGLGKGSRILRDFVDPIEKLSSTDFDLIGKALDPDHRPTGPDAEVITFMKRSFQNPEIRNVVDFVYKYANGTRKHPVYPDELREFGERVNELKGSVGSEDRLYDLLLARTHDFKAFDTDRTRVRTESSISSVEASGVPETKGHARSDTDRTGVRTESRISSVEASGVPKTKGHARSDSDASSRGFDDTSHSAPVARAGAGAGGHKKITKEEKFNHFLDAPFNIMGKETTRRQFLADNIAHTIGHDLFTKGTIKVLDRRADSKEPLPAIRENVRNILNECQDMDITPAFVYNYLKLTPDQKQYRGRTIEMDGMKIGGEKRNRYEMNMFIKKHLEKNPAAKGLSSVAKGSSPAPSTTPVTGKGGYEPSKGGASR